LYVVIKDKSLEDLALSRTSYFHLSRLNELFEKLELRRKTASKDLLRQLQVQYNFLVLSQTLESDDLPMASGNSTTAPSPPSSSHQPVMDDEDDDVLDPSEQTQRPIDNALNQQRLNAWHPILDPVFVIVALFYLGVIMVPVGMSSIYSVG
jgi:hypothetical protein